MGLESLALSWREPDRLQDAQVVIVPANFGGHGNQWRSLMESDAYDQPEDNPTGRDPRLQLWSRLDPIIWSLTIDVPDDGFQASVRQNNNQLPALFASPGTASLAPGAVIVYE